MILEVRGRTCIAIVLEKVAAPPSRMVAGDGRRGDGLERKEAIQETASLFGCTA